MSPWRDKTYCQSPQCKNECGRKLPEALLRHANDLDVPLSWSYFCGEPNKDDNDNGTNERRA